jgi:hypothetical protein
VTHRVIVASTDGALLAVTEASCVPRAGELIATAGEDGATRTWRVVQVIWRADRGELTAALTVELP